MRNCIGMEILQAKEYLASIDLSDIEYISITRDRLRYVGVEKVVALQERSQGLQVITSAFPVEIYK